MYHCKKSDLKKCRIEAYDVEGKRAKDEIDLVLPYMQAENNII